MAGLFALGSGTAGADPAEAFFDDSRIPEIRLYFDDPNWYNTLYQAHANDRNDPYFPARFRSGDVEIARIGARFKGNASFRRGGTKKSFKLDFNRFDENATFLGLKKLNLNNGDLQPDLMREKLFLDFTSKFMPASRVVHVRVYVNDVYWGLYIAVEQPDKTMMRSRFGPDEDGNLYEAVDFRGDLSYLGPDPTPYRQRYELKTNETTGDYSDLIRFLDILNNTPPAELPAKLEPVCDVENMLAAIAVNVLFTNLESYLGSAGEYFLYHRDDTGQFVYLHWDTNETFGTTGDGTPRIANPFTFDPFWLPTAATGPGGLPGGMGGSARPLMQKLWAVDSYKRLYLRLLARMLREGFEPPKMEARIRELADRIRPHVYEDSRKLFTNAQFETALTSQITGGGAGGMMPGGGVPIYGLMQFVRERYNFLRPWLNARAEPADLRLNELAAAGGGHADGAGEPDPWLELHNLGPGTLNLAGFYLTDEPQAPTKWALPPRELADGAFFVVWLDGETQEGPDHAPFRAAAGGGSLYLYHVSGGEAKLIDAVNYPASAAGQSYIRLGSLGADWRLVHQPTPLAANPPAGALAGQGTGRLRINEFMADNQSTIEDPDQRGAFEDWIEVYNPGETAVEMGGMYLTDDLRNPTKWRIPAGVTIPPRGFLLFWADNDPRQGPRHTNFRLAAEGEEIGLFEPDGKTLIDSVRFSEQQPDVSSGRYPDGGDEWAFFRPATPGAPNLEPLASWVVNGASLRPGPLAPAVIASAFGQGLASRALAADGATLPVELDGTSVEVKDAAGGSHAARLYFVSPGQVNFVVPAGAALGRGRVTVRREGRVVASGEIWLDAAAPGLFAASAGREAGGVYLTLFGTGIRGVRDKSQVVVQVGGETVPVLYFGPQGQFEGLDQINAGPLPSVRATAAEAPVTVRVGGRRANEVKVALP